MVAACSCWNQFCKGKLELISRCDGLKDLGVLPDLPPPNIVFLAAHLFHEVKKPHGSVFTLQGLAVLQEGYLC